jgi:asparagine synthase (glutamine-hydrolysing)
VEELLSPGALARSGYFEPRAVARLVQKCRSQGALGFRDNMALVGILSVQLLDHQFTRGSAATTAPPLSVTP